MTGYGFLSVSIWVGLNHDKRKNWLAWVLAVLYAISDELHQTLTPGRHPSIIDVVIFDGGGAALGLAIRAAWQRYYKNERSGVKTDRY